MRPRPHVERTDYRVPLKVPIHMGANRMIDDVAGVYLRLPRWEGPPFGDDFGKKAAGMVELDGEHTFAEPAALRPAGAGGVERAVGEHLQRQGRGVEVPHPLGRRAPDWLHTALLFGDTRITLASFAVVNRDYR